MQCSYFAHFHIRNKEKSKMADLFEYKCPCCGGAIEFDSASQQLKCPYCDNTFEVETLKAYDEELKNEASENMEWEQNSQSEWTEGETEGMRVYSCESCGGEIIGDETLAATKCPYCDNPVVMKGQFSGALRPDYVIPFRLDKKAAKEGLKKHLFGKRLLPKVFKDENHLDEVKGIYVPFWLFDADVDANVHYKATRVRHWTSGNYRYTERSTFRVTREGELGFNRIPVDGSSSMADDLMESVEPYDWKDAKDFQTAYLAGYLADKYDVDDKQSVERANQRLKESTENAFRKTVKGYDTVTTESSNLRLKNNSVKYALYPVWILNTTWRDKKYTFAMNGQTGKFVGNLPLDKKAYATWLCGLWAGITAVSFAILMAISMFT